jgi:hypothetical protein
VRQQIVVKSIRDWGDMRVEREHPTEKHQMQMETINIIPFDEPFEFSTSLAFAVSLFLLLIQFKKMFTMNDVNVLIKSI